MIDTLLKLWPVITGTAVGSWVAFRWLFGRWTHTRSIEAAKKDRAEELAEKAIETARAQAAADRAQADAAIAAHLHLLETTVTAQAAEIVRLNSALEVSHESEVEAWKRYRAKAAATTQPTPPNVAGGTT